MKSPVQTHQKSVIKHKKDALVCVLRLFLQKNSLSRIIIPEPITYYGLNLKILAFFNNMEQQVRQMMNRAVFFFLFVCFLIEF